MPWEPDEVKTGIVHYKSTEKTMRFSLPISAYYTKSELETKLEDVRTELDDAAEKLYNSCSMVIYRFDFAVDKKILSTTDRLVDTNFDDGFLQHLKDQNWIFIHNLLKEIGDGALVDGKFSFEGTSYKTEDLGKGG